MSTAMQLMKPLPKRLHQRSKSILRRLKRDQEKLARAAYAEMGKVYGIHIGQEFVGPWGARYSIHEIHWHCLLSDGPLLVLNAEGLDLKLGKSWGNMIKEGLKPVKPVRK